MPPFIRARLRAVAVEVSRSGRHRFIWRRILLVSPSSRRRLCGVSKRRRPLAVSRQTPPLSPPTGCCCRPLSSVRPRLGCLNLHASLLPRWRGAAPVQRAIMAGDTQTGVDVMAMDAGLDTGPIALRETIPILPENTAGDLTAHLAPIAAKLAVSALELLSADLLEFRQQSAVGVCYARKIEKSEAEIDWTRGAERVRNQVHGLSPAPGAYSKILIGSREESIKLLRVEMAAGSGPSGTLLSEDMSVACGTGAIRVLEGQRAGKTVMSGRDLMRGAKLARGAVFRQSLTPSSVPGS